MDYMSGDLIGDERLIIKSQKFFYAATISLENKAQESK
jgi:hypothetical protein